MCLPALAAVPAALAGAGGAAGAATAGISLTSALSTVGTVAGLAGTGLSMYGQLQASKAQANAAEFEAKVGEIRAKDAIDRGQEEENRSRARTRQILGSQRATLAAGGLDITSGSPLDMLGATAEVGELEALTIKSNAEREAWGLQTGANMAQASAANYRAAGPLAAAGTALSGLGTVSDRWYKMYRPAGSSV